MLSNHLTYPLEPQVPVGLSRLVEHFCLQRLCVWLKSLPNVKRFDRKCERTVKAKPSRYDARFIRKSPD
jgi:hypothetical protein